MEPVFVDHGFDLGQFGDLMDQGRRIVTGQDMATAAAIGGPALGDRTDLLGGDQATLCPAMSRLAAPLSTGGGCGWPALEPDGIGRRRLGGIGGVELEPGLEIAEALLQFRDPSREGVQQGQDGNLGFRWDGVPERCRDGRPRDHDNNTTDLLYKKFGS
jgi:hypothetical protein